MKKFFPKQTMLIGFGLCLALAIGAFMFVSKSQAKESFTYPDWPAFSIVYEDWGQNRGTNSSGGFVRVRLSYSDRHNWRSEILENSTMPSINGSIDEMTPESLTHFDSLVHL